MQGEPVGGKFGSENWYASRGRGRSFSRGRGRSNSKGRGRISSDISMEGNQSNVSADQGGQGSYQRPTRGNLRNV